MIHSNVYSEVFLSKPPLIFLSLDCIWFCFPHRIKKKTTRVSLTISSPVNETSNIRSSYSTLVQPLCIDPQRVGSVLCLLRGPGKGDTGPEKKESMQLSWKVYVRRASSCMTSERARMKSMGLRNNFMAVLWVGHLSVCQTIRDSWCLRAQTHNKSIPTIQEVNSSLIKKSGGRGGAFSKT